MASASGRQPRPNANAYVGKTPEAHPDVNMPDPAHRGCTSLHPSKDSVHEPPFQLRHSPVATLEVIAE